MSSLALPRRLERAFKSLRLGRSPRTLFRVVRDRQIEEASIHSIKSTVASISIAEISNTLRGVLKGDTADHEVFEISPGVSRYLAEAPDWAIRLILRRNRITNAEKILEMFTLLTSTPEAALMAEKLREPAIYNYSVRSRR
jgi:hypothetical protein